MGITQPLGFVRQVAEKVLPALPPLDTEKRTLILPFEHDATLRVTSTLRDALYSETSQCISVPDNVPQQLVNKWNYLWSQTPTPVDIDDTAQAQTRGHRAGADYAIAGRVDSATADDVSFELSLIDVQSGQEVSRQTFTSETWEALALPAELRGVWSSSHYILGVLVFAVLWPLMLVAVIRSVLKVENNGLTLFALIIIVAVPIALAYPGQLKIRY
jgi:hypothetical protein